MVKYKKNSVTILIAVKTADRNNAVFFSLGELKRLMWNKGRSNKNEGQV